MDKQQTKDIALLWLTNVLLQSDTTVYPTDRNFVILIIVSAKIKTSSSGCSVVDVIVPWYLGNTRAFTAEVERAILGGATVHINLHIPHSFVSVLFIADGLYIY